jgi:AcrR family transcriptional regulator
MESTTRERPGRPRDPDVDRRVEEAAVDLFGRAGWTGFSIDAVARAAGVGKASVYLRWDSKEELLTEAVATAFRPIAAIDTGDVRQDLVALATLLLELYGGRNGPAARRMTLESASIPGIAERWNGVRHSQIAAARAVVRRAVDRGQLPTGTSASLLLDALCGAAMNRPVAVPEHLRARAEQTRDRYAADLVDLLLAGATAGRGQR